MYTLYCTYCTDMHTSLYIENMLKREGHDASLNLMQHPLINMNQSKANKRVTTQLKRDIIQCHPPLDRILFVLHNIWPHLFNFKQKNCTTGASVNKVILFLCIYVCRAKTIPGRVENACGLHIINAQSAITVVCGIRFLNKQNRLGAKLRWEPIPDLLPGLPEAFNMDRTLVPVISLWCIYYCFNTQTWSVLLDILLLAAWVLRIQHSVRTKKVLHKLSWAHISS